MNWHVRNLLFWLIVKVLALPFTGAVSLANLAMEFPSQSPMTRRHALRQTFFYSAALAMAGRLPAALAQEASAQDHHFLALGDFGSLGQRPEVTLDPHVGAFSTPTPFATPPKIIWAPQQEPVAAAMQAYVQDHQIQTQGLFLLGDNFYGSFKGGVNSPRWKSGFEDMYPASIFPGPCWAMLGNHDYDEESGLKMAAQLDYADSHPGTRWRMPSKWYRVDWPAKDPIITCLVLDTNYHNGYLYLTPEERAHQLSWLKGELARPRVAPWLVCMGHHPLYSNGSHGDTPSLIKDWGPLFQQHNVAFYFCGHDHDLQHLEFEDTCTSFVVSGGGGAHISGIRKPGRGVYSQSVNGFTHLQINREKFVVRHIDTAGKQLHAFQKSIDGRMEILG